MADPVELYMARSIDALEKIALNHYETRNIKEKKLESMYKAADAVYKIIGLDILDEEKTYIYLLRYLKITDFISDKETDRKFFDLRFGTIIEKTRTLSEKLRDNLVTRYDEMSQLEKGVPTMPSKIIKLDKPKPFFTTELFVNSKQLFDAYKAQRDILIMDTRGKSEYKESHLKIFLSINVAEEYIEPGLSAHVLGSKLPSEIKVHYDVRETFEYIVLVDWDTTPKTWMSSKLHTLRTILTMWDVNKKYKHPPYILNGGYMGFIDSYPTFSTNPHVLYNQRYCDLDELLDLDAIQYPTELTTVSQVVQLVKSNKIEASADEMMDQLCNIIAKQLRVELDLLNCQAKVYDTVKKLGITADTAEVKMLLEHKQSLDLEVNDLESAKIITDERKSILSKQMQPLLPSYHDRDKEGVLAQKMLDIDKNEKRIVQAVKRRKRLVDECEKLLIASAKAPVSEPKASEDLDVASSSGDFNSLPKQQHSKPIPAINRNTKPSTSVSSVKQPPSNIGLTGIVNIRNTCYMNSVIQCFRHIPVIRDFFCEGTYNEHVNKRDPAIIYETAHLMRSLWTGSHARVRPTQFYNKIGTMNPVFQEGHHEDCMEFFLLFLNALSEDCTVDVVPRVKYNSAKHEAWFYRLGKKTSFFMENFYHQTRISFICSGCQKKCQKYEMENMFMLCVPNTDLFYVEDLIERYLSDQDMVNYYCSKCDMQVKLSKDVSYQPKVAVIVLKRYMYEGGVLQRKNNACHFPLTNLKIGHAYYKLWSISMHQGTMFAGHYTAACLNPYDGKWYEYNDETVTPMDINSNYVKVKAYLLFYQIIDAHKNAGFDKL